MKAVFAALALLASVPIAAQQLGIGGADARSRAIDGPAGMPRR